MTLNQCLGRRKLSADLLLLFLQVLDAHCVGEVGLLDLVSPPLQLFHAPLLQANLPSTGLSPPTEELKHRLPHSVASLFVEAQRVHVPQDGIFDELDADIALCTARRIFLPPKAVEVEIAGSGPTQRVGDAHPAAALAAVQHRLKGMRVSLRLVFTLVPAAQDVLDDLERLLVYQHFVATGVLNPSEVTHPA